MSDRLDIDALEELALQLRRHAEPQPVSRQRRTLAILAPVAVGLGVLAVLVLPAGGRPVDALAAARGVLNPKNTILTYTYVATTRFPAPQPPLVTEATVWSSTDRWRYLNPHLLQSGRSNGRQESSFVDGVATTFTAGARSQRVVEGITDPRAAMARDLFGLSLDLRVVLDRGAVRDLGTQRYAGREVRRLLSVERRGKIHRIENRITYDVDPGTFEPRHVHVVSTFQGRTSRSTIITDARIVRFQRLPRTDANLRLFTIPIPPGTSITKYQAIPGRSGTRKVCARPRQPEVPLCP